MIITKSSRPIKKVKYPIFIIVEIKYYISDETEDYVSKDLFWQKIKGDYEYKITIKTLKKIQIETRFNVIEYQIYRDKDDMIEALLKKLQFNLALI